MIAILAAVGSLILAISLIQLANGYMGTLIGIRLSAGDVEPAVIGVVTSAYFAGYVTGALVCHRLIQRAGHIRAFAAFAALVVGSVLGHALYFHPVPWAVLRALTGFGCAGLFVATESWLTAKATSANRGTVFAIYMVATYATFAGSQFALNLASPGEFTLFALAAILICAALVIVATTRAEQPVITPGGRLRAGELVTAAPVAVAGCFAAGLITGSFYALVPVYGQSSAYSLLQISSYMALAIFGGLVLQIPIARLSDRFDRRLVAGLAAFAFAAVAQLIAPGPHTYWFYLCWLLLGGFMSVIYPVCVAHANDRMAAEHAVPVSGRLIVISGAGSILGPLLGSGVMSAFGIGGLFDYMAAAAALFAVFALSRTVRVRSPPYKSRRPFLLVPGIFAHDLPRASAEARTGISVAAGERRPRIGG
ncbi:MFS transporter [Inquilinus limosus]|uniref:MFS transporter n=1 Tax=Inquilinus limosus TaxID=171674 RepID=UPI000414A2AC|nr:MFS transporter [Inquilinus limosus]